MGFRVDVNMLPDQMTGENCEIVLRIFQSDSGEQDRQKEKHTHTQKTGLLHESLWSEFTQKVSLFQGRK